MTLPLLQMPMVMLGLHQPSALGWAVLCGVSHLQQRLECRNQVVHIYASFIAKVPPQGYLHEAAGAGCQGLWNKMLITCIHRPELAECDDPSIDPHAWQCIASLCKRSRALQGKGTISACSFSWYCVAILRCIYCWEGKLESDLGDSHMTASLQ